MPTQAGYRYKIKVLVTAHVCRSWEREIHSWSYLVDQLELSFLPLVCIQLCMLRLFVQLTLLYSQTKEET